MIWQQIQTKRERAADYWKALCKIAPDPAKCLEASSKEKLAYLVQFARSQPELTLSSITLETRERVRDTKSSYLAQYAKDPLGALEYWRTVQRTLATIKSKLEKRQVVKVFLGPTPFASPTTQEITVPWNWLKQTRQGMIAYSDSRLILALKPLATPTDHIEIFAATSCRIPTERILSPAEKSFLAVYHGADTLMAFGASAESAERTLQRRINIAMSKLMEPDHA